MAKKQYIAPVSERVFPESLMDGMNPGRGGVIGSLIIGASGGATTVDPTHAICAPGRNLYI